jgi:hypothetical protein
LVDLSLKKRDWLFIAEITLGVATFMFSYARYKVGAQ